LRAGLVQAIDGQAQEWKNIVFDDVIQEDGVGIE